jgi:2-octaprenyl-3-methyl-6-methoxy-1,4-benzoquinol hydroxylase/2-octaprenylphenol hydroxylase
MNDRTIRADVAIAGAGMVGASAASLLARCGLSVALIERFEPQPFDATGSVGLRVSAISPGSAAVLEEAGAWREIESVRACPYRRMQVEDGANSDESLVFEAPAFALERLGTIVENHLVQSALWNAVCSNALIRRLCPDSVASIHPESDAIRLELESGVSVQAGLLIGADGAQSGIRRLAGIGQEIWEYNQKGVVSVVRKSEDNPGVAWQRFLAGGPLAFLPLADGSSSIVWTLPTAEADRVLSLNEKAFGAALAQASVGWLGDFASCGERAAFPLIMRLSERYVANRIVLLGDAAHVVHPLAGQGVNLGLADAAALVETLLESRRQGRDIAAPAALARFERWRKSESQMMAGGIHGLRALFMQQGLGPARKLGLKLVSRSWVAREAFLKRAAGVNRNAPRISRGDSLQSLLRGT